MELKIENWDGELAVRLPDWLVDKHRLKDGDEFDWSGVEAELYREEESRRASGADATAP